MSFESRQYCGVFAGADLDFSACGKISTVTSEDLEIAVSDYSTKR
jgi:hypothetical protein